MNSGLLNKILVILFLCVFPFRSIYAEKVSLDSLWHQWLNRDLTDTVRLAGLNSYITQRHISNHPDSALLLARLLLDSAVYWNNKAYQGVSFDKMGQVFALQGKAGKAVQAYMTAEKIFQQANDSVGMAMTVFHLGELYDINGQFSEAQPYLLQALSLYRGLGKKAGESAALNSLGILKSNQRIYDSARYFLELSLEIKKNEKTGKA